MSADKLVYIIKAGSTFPDMAAEQGDFEDWIISGLGLDVALLDVVDVENGMELPDISSVSGAVITGSHAMVTRNLHWSLSLETWTRQLVLAKIPVLGICYGHQILARAMGGTVDFHSQGTEIGTREITRLPAGGQDILFKGLPERFKGHTVHSQTVTRLPDNAVLLACNSFEPHHGFRIGDSAWGVQFHPEFSVRAMEGYIGHMADTVRQEGQDPEKLIRDLDNTPEAAELLERFGRLAVGN
ncbi:MAG: glutamine amidotransferase [Desulfobacterales bacterium]|nr:glutamine amidotransferase [Desulfobacterales bacterium]